MPLNNSEDHRWFVEDVDLDMLQGYADMEDNAPVGRAFTYLRNFRSDVTQALMYGVTFKKPLMIVLADVMIAMGTKREDIDNTFGTPGLIKQVDAQNEMVEKYVASQNEALDEDGHAGGDKY